MHKQGLSWAEIGEQMGQRSRAVTADTYSHTIADYREIDRRPLLFCRLDMTSHRGRRWRRLVAAGLVLAVVVAAGLSTFRYFGSETAGATMSNRGTPVRVTERDQRVLARMGRFTGFTGKMFLLRSEAGRSFYRVPRTDGSDCFATSAVGSVAIEASVCSADFPEQRPILDFSVFGADRPDTKLRVISAQGIASDEVAEIRLVSQNGEDLRTVPVIGNVYAVRDVPTDAPAAVVAVDRGGNTLFRSGSGGST